MRFPLGAMSVGDILDRGVKLLLARLFTFYFINLIFLLPSLIFILVTPLVVAQEVQESFLLVYAAGGILVLALNLVLAPLGSAAILYVIAQEYVEQRATLAAALAFPFKRFFSLVSVSFLNGLIVLFGCCLCCIPGIIFFVWYSLAAQVVVVDTLGPFQSLERSQKLTAGFRWRLLGLFLVLGAIFFANLMIQGAVTTIRPGMRPLFREGFQLELVLESYPNFVVHQVLSFLLNSLVQTYISICTTLFYFDLRIRKEGFDLELAARVQSGERPS